MKVEGISLPPLLLIQSLDKMQCNCHTLSFGWRQGRITKCMPLKYSPDESFFLFFFFFAQPYQTRWLLLLLNTNFDVTPRMCERMIVLLLSVWLAVMKGKSRCISRYIDLWKPRACFKMSTKLPTSPEPWPPRAKRCRQTCMKSFRRRSFLLNYYYGRELHFLISL